jgi:hypothetical protein
MTEQQKHLKSVIDQQKTLFGEIQDLSNQLNMKRESAMKLQGILEYLTGTGVTLPEEESSSPFPEVVENKEE